ncbi:MAG: 6-phosphogluconolactonase [Acidobacteriota bacterium]
MSAQTIAYIGTYTQGFARGIYSLRYDGKSGGLTPLAVIPSVSPSFLAVSPNRRVLVAVNESRRYNGILNSGSVSSFSIDPATGDLAPISVVPSRGADPAHLSFDRTGKWLFVANNGGGSIAVFPVAGDGTLSDAAHVVEHQGASNANPVRQEAPHVHSVDISPDNRFLYVADLGKDEIAVYDFDAASGRLTPHTQAALKPGSGPRHIAFSRDRRYLYVVSELSATVTTFRHDAATGSLEELQTISTLPMGYRGDKSAAEIAVDPSGRFLFASNRFHNSIAAFSIDAEQGRLSLIGIVATQGRTPRHFAIDSEGAHLIVANQDTDTLTVFNIDPDSGALTLASEPLGVPRPVCVLLVNLP